MWREDRRANFGFLLWLGFFGSTENMLSLRERV